jgi:hypothetical protein
MGTGRMNALSRPGTPRRLPRPEADAKLSRESISPWEENTVGLAALEGYEDEYNRLGSILLGSQEPILRMRMGAILLTSWLTWAQNTKL